MLGFVALTCVCLPLPTSHRAKAYITANNLYCSQYSKDQCSWPCEYDEGVGCQVDGHLYYQVWNCYGSIVSAGGKHAVRG